MVKTILETAPELSDRHRYRFGRLARLPKVRQGEAEEIAVWMVTSQGAE